MIGKLCWSVFPFYDTHTKTNGFKKRPVLVIAGPRNNDYTVLPVSSVSIRTNIDSTYDIRVDPTNYPKLGLTKTCYVRTHKQTIVHQSSLVHPMGDMRTDYPDLYIRILELLEKFNKTVIDQAL